MKRESAKRGYMTSDEVKEHLKGIGTINARETYLNDILKKKGMLSDGTRKSVYENLGQIYEKRGDMKKAREFYGEAGNSVKVNEADLRRYGQAVHSGSYVAGMDEGLRKMNTPESLKLLAELEQKRKAALISDAEGNLRKATMYKKQAHGRFRAYRLYSNKDSERKACALDDAKGDFEHMLSALEDAGRQYKLAGDEGKVKMIDDKIDKEKERLTRQIMKVIVDEDDPNSGYFQHRFYNSIYTASHKVPQIFKEEKARLERRKGLEGALGSASLAILGLLSGLFFLSTRVTGNVIGMSAGKSSLIGLGLLVVGLISGFFWLRKKRK